MRLITPEIDIRAVKIGGENPIVIQSMTNTQTADSFATAKQCMELADAGSELVRLTVNTQFAAKSLPEIRKILDSKGYKHLPLIGDFHYNGHTLLSEYPKLAKTLDKYRINPGNVGYGDKHEYNFGTIIKTAIHYDKPVRIGVNWGSLDQDLLTEMMNKNAMRRSRRASLRPCPPMAWASKLSEVLPASGVAKTTNEPKSDKEVLIDAMVTSALRSSELAEKLGLSQNKIILSVKISLLQDMVAAYELLAKTMQKNKHLYALHLGLTEAGSGVQGLVSSSAALAILLQKGIGDTIRISLTPTPTEPRTQEVEACKALLQSLGLRYYKPLITSCPGCGRTDSHFFQDLAREVNDHVTKKMPIWQKKYPAIAQLKIAVMGCVVNGPGESKHADIAISLPGKLEKPVAPIYIHGKYVKSLQGEKIPEQFIRILEDFVKENYC